VVKKGTRVTKMFSIPVAKSAKGRKVVLREKIMFVTSKIPVAEIISLKKDTGKRQGITPGTQEFVFV
jgi:hypothetical protein